MMRLTAAQFREMQAEEVAAKGKRHKYNARACYRCENCNAGYDKKPDLCQSCFRKRFMRFDSRAEARHWDGLWLQQRMKHITDLRRQVAYPITINGLTVGSYIADFEYRVGLETHVVDVKGGTATDTELSHFKRKCVEAIYSLTVEIVAAGRRNTGA